MINNVQLIVKLPQDLKGFIFENLIVLCQKPLGSEQATPFVLQQKPDLFLCEICLATAK